MNKVPVQNVIPGLIEPFPLLVLIVTCLVGDQQPFAFLTNASQGNVMPGVAILEPMPPLSKEYRVKRSLKQLWHLRSAPPIVAIEHKLDPPLVTLMVGIGIPLSFLTLPLWWYVLQAI